MSSRDSAAPAPPLMTGRPRARGRRLSLRAPRPELAAVLVLAAALDLWALSRNGWANSYYSAAVRSMSTSWHNFLFASLDPSGVMTVDKPPLSLWVQALSVRAFGYHPLSLLVPQALMGVASVAVLYDLVRRRFGRLGAFIAALAFALTPITVAIFRYNQPDALLVLCSLGALWFTVRALEDGRTRWLVLAGVCVGLGFETKMLVALVVVPGIAAAWLWAAPGARAFARAGGRLRAAGQLLAGGAAMVIVGGAWPLLVELTPASQRPWISGTSDNRVLSLIFEYNGVGRVDGQAGGPGGFGGSQFGGAPGPLRLLNSALGGQASWLLGFAAVSGLALLLATRLRRSDARTGWLLAVGGAFVTTAALFSFASGIFHPYYVSLLAPFLAAIVGAGAAHFIAGREGARLLGPLAIAAGVLTELVVLGDYAGQLRWLVGVVIVLGAASAAVLAAGLGRRARLAAVAVATGALMIAPAVWAVDTLGHSVSGTFPEGGPSSALAAAGPSRPGGAGARAGFGGFGGLPPGAAAGAGPSGAEGPGPGAGTVPLFGPSAGAAGGQSGTPPFGAGRGTRGLRGGPGGGLGGFGRSVSSQVLAYVKAHGGGTIAVSSQSSAAGSIISEGADVAGIGGFSGRESSVSVSWLATELRDGKIRWVLDEEGSGTASAGSAVLGGLGALGGGAAPAGGSARGSGGRPGDSRAGSRKAIEAAARSCTRVSVGSGESSSSRSGTAVLYDCQGDAAALERAAA
ncbi:MAG TPA: glycosyltransferase family 39 protein [Solirubrobacteraceae bacterium]|jgi:4-amino-4-deoxy-L-arabinose transferase-like glycosyltransferase|nr:glycosyltransferase family 39 protein [Solirubrobacteraceae bacterium]